MKYRYICNNIVPYLNLDRLMDPYYVARDISVVIPLYNKAAEIGATLRSVLCQTQPPREIIVVDDGSTDGSAEIVERMGSWAVTLVRRSNGGVSAARNEAMRMASGRWVALLDGDDMWYPDYLKDMASLIARYPDCGAYGSGFYVECDGRRTLGDTPRNGGGGDSRFLSRVDEPLRVDTLGYGVAARSCAATRRVPRGDAHGRGSISMDQDRALGSGGFLADAFGGLFAVGLQSFGGELPSRAYALFVRGSVRPRGGRDEQRIRGSRGIGQGVDRERERRDRCRGPRRGVLLLQSPFAPYRDQSPHTQRSAAAFAARGFHGIQSVGLGRRPKGIVVSRFAVSGGMRQQSAARGGGELRGSSNRKY